MTRRECTDQFRTGWFVESVVSASLIVLVVRSRRPFFRSRPDTRLLWATLGVVAVTLVLPYLPLASVRGLTPLPPSFLALLALIVVAYILLRRAREADLLPPLRDAGRQLTGSCKEQGRAAQRW
jgi:magnesium-transporting ATPase (P-type)